ncbi:SUN domain-containing ossification factor isoform X2 [Topomyia yanbarensis]|uniref:SUN domain-containing ossification factor isoform X2 n=1 Tax=Topomyia yanbarensis TaxID=2498891 RepID=UPI00273C31EB|nr:SUN domain-containing ossification factor isoform X2 [Topomyia yanbarensis]XP_058819919.1 SUN domain-containing ossification factor isoform X2 [Topomyia yanbarensis]XP_058819920.1 SUN domain-containing ossification factor isoform X2 [Topomyia yanbarensis]XP_058819921.1 SUN domain-containing ossification factor isoform X2 [Topomyia yanbarensis]
MFYMVNVYLVLICYIEWHLSMKLLEVLLERVRRMKKLTVLLTFCWVLLVSQILAITSLYNDGLQNIPGPPSVVTLVDHQNNELNIESKLEENIEATLKNISHQLVDPSTIDEVNVEQAEADLTQPLEQLEPTLIPMRTDPEQYEQLEAKINDSGGGGGGEAYFAPDPAEQASDEDFEHTTVQNITDDSQQGSEVNLTEENPMPVFSEWAQKQMADAEKKLGENVNASAMKRNMKPSGSKMPPLKLRAKNYAAPDCGAKIIASNAEAQSTGSVLTSHKDEYLLNPCTSKIWFVVELCEPIQAERIEMANFELFSSSPKDFSISVTNRFPSRDWSNVGQFTAKDERDVQSFNLHPHLYGKFVRVEIHSHYNSEHYCPVSLFRVYGTSEFEAFETDNTPSLGDDGDEDELVASSIQLEGEILVDNSQQEEGLDSTGNKVKKTENILKSAGEAVMSIVKKAAEALGKSNEDNNQENKTSHSTEGEVINDTNRSIHFEANELNDMATIPQHSRNRCWSLAYQPMCESCSLDLRTRLQQMMNCKHNLLDNLLSIELISSSFNESQHLLCANILGFSLNKGEDVESWNLNRSILSWLPVELLAGFCNIRAFERGLIEIRGIENSTDIEDFERSSVEQDSLLSQPQTSEDSRNVEIEQPALVVDPSVNTVMKEDSHAAAPGAQEDQQKPAAQEDVNIFNINEGTTTDAPVVDHQKHEEIPSPAPPVHAGDFSQQDKEKDEILTNGGNLEDIDNLLLAEQPHLDGTVVGGSGTNIPTITSTTSTTPSPSGSPASQKGQPESVFLRLSNRIKALERNMSLSGQYLEELSRRYRKQVEELQHSYAKTLHEIEEQNRRIRESEASLREENNRLREDFFTFRDSLLSWQNITIVFGTVFVVHIVICWVMVRSGRVRPSELERDLIDKELAQVSSGKPIIGKLLRRKSIDGITGGSQSLGSLKKKRPSEEALNISGTYENLLIKDEGGGDTVKAERKKSRNKHRKISTPCMQQSVNGKTKRATSAEPPEVRKVTKPDLIRTESAPEPRRFTPEMIKPDEHNRIDELPMLEDNDEFIIPTASDLSYNEFVPDSTSEVIKTNGMTSSSSSIDSKQTNKSGKGRRLSSPAFFKPSFLRASRKSSGKKSTPSQNVSSASSSNTSSNGSSNAKISINIHNSGSYDVPSPVASSHNANVTTTSSGNEWYKLKKTSSQDKFTKRQSKSESPEIETVENGSATPSDHVDRKLKTSISFNGSTSSSERKFSGGGGSIRRLFRKVF